MSEFEYQPLVPISSQKLVENDAELGFIRPDAPSRCTWKPGSDLTSSPHIFQPHLERLNIMPNVLYAVGNTPLIRLNKIPKSFGIKCEMLAKCEYFNPAGSVKDRIAVRMIEDAEKRGLLKPGDTIIEPTSGNTGLGLALGAAIKGYRCIIIMPLKMSNEKVDALKALGAEVIRTPTAASFDSPEGTIAVAHKLSKQIPNSIILNQYRNAFNPVAHYEHTAQEILNQCDGKVDAIVCGAGTGGTICGIGRKIKDSCPSCKVVGADPFGSSLSYPDELNESNVTFYEVEGIGYDFIPTVLDRSVVDKWYKTNDRDSLLMARRLIKEEGLLCGGSSGSAMTVALEVAKSMSEGQRLVVILPDGTRNYMTKFISDSWMKVRGLKGIDDIKHIWWTSLPVSVLRLKEPLTIPSTMQCLTAIEKMKEAGLDFMFVSEEGSIIGAVTIQKILSNLTEARSSLKDVVGKVVDSVRTVEASTPLGRISYITQQEKLVLVECHSQTISDGCLNKNGSDSLMKYATSKDLLEFICSSTSSNCEA